MERSKKLTVPVTPDEMRELKKIALDEDTSLSEMIHKVLLEFLDRKRQEKSSKTQEQK